MKIMKIKEIIRNLGICYVYRWELRLPVGDNVSRWCIRLPVWGSFDECIRMRNISKTFYQKVLGVLVTWGLNRGELEAQQYAFVKRE